MKLNAIRAWFRSYVSFLLSFGPPVFPRTDPTDREIGFFFYGLGVGILLCFLIIFARI